MDDTSRKLRVQTGELPHTLYRTHVVECDKPENLYTFEFMADYLTMMAILDRSIAQRLANSCKITPLQYRILLRLQIDGTQQITALSQRLSSKLSTTSSAAGHLAEMGLAARGESANDMRAVELSITSDGQRALGGADDELAAMMSDYWHTLTQEQLKAALTSSVSAVERHCVPRMENGKVRLDTALMETVFISRSLTTRALHEQGLTINDFRVLLALRMQDGSSTATDIARFLFLNSCDITPCLKHLEATGLITRQRSSENRRIRNVSLTERGYSRLSELMPIAFDALHETCHSSDELIAIHISAARDMVDRQRSRNPF